MVKWAASEREEAKCRRGGEVPESRSGVAQLIKGGVSPELVARVVVTPGFSEQRSLRSPETTPTGRRQCAASRGGVAASGSNREGRRRRAADRRHNEFRQIS
ncbi:hypothetical protein U1Q18_026543 [Sarracenia purpurea var. burkii]